MSEDDLQERTSSKRYADSSKESEKLKDEYTKVGYGSAILALERSRMHKSWAKSGQQIRLGLKEVENAIQEKIQSFDLRSSTRLTEKQIDEVMGAASTALKTASIAAMSSLRDSLDVSLRRGARAANGVLKQNGIEPLSIEELAKVMEEAAKETAKPWPLKNPSTYDKRIINASTIHLNQLKNNLSRTYDKGKVSSKILLATKGGIRRIGATSVKGGSFANRLQMILASEEVRITNEVTIRMYRFRDIEFAYWRLSPTHPWYGGGEVCEWLASIPYGGSMEDLKNAGLEDVVLDGLHAMDDWPTYPHPFCQCYPEPIITIQ